MTRHIVKKIRKLVEDLKYYSDKLNAGDLPSRSDIIKAKSIKKEIEEYLKEVTDILNSNAISRIERDVTRICEGNESAEGIRRDLVSFLENIERILG
jgi:DNA polymerase/3'-5' exonuclease PolX